MQPASPTSDSENGGRKRVCKACDRCRLKKSKCDGENPCNRCQADNAICVFGERKKAQDKVYPKGYVEMLERQQQQLVNGLREFYLRALNNQGWIGPPLKDAAHGFPLTHDILSRLGALDINSRDCCDSFEDDFDTLKEMVAATSEGVVTPTTAEIQDFSSGRTPETEQNSPQLFADEPLLPPASILSTPSSQSPLEPSLGFSPPAPFSLNPTIMQAQHQTFIQPLISPDIEMDYLAPYSNCGLVQEKLSACLPLSPMLHWQDLDFAPNYETSFS